MDPQQRLLLEVVYEALEDGKPAGWDNPWYDMLMPRQLVSLSKRSTGLKPRCFAVVLLMTTTQ